MLYQIELFKRNAGLKNRLNGSKDENNDSCLNRHKIVLGFFDHMKFSDKNDFLEITSLSNDFMEPSDPYYRYHIALFDIPTGLSEIEKAVYENGKTNILTGLLNDGSDYLYMIITLKMNTDIFEHISNTNDLYKSVFQKIKKCHSENTSGNEPFALFGSPGSIDFVLICAMNLKSNGDISNNERFNKLLQLPFHLRRLRMEDPRYAYFDFSTSFITYDNKTEIGDIDAGIRCAAHIRCTTLHFRKPAQKIEDEFKKHLYNNGFSIEPSPVTVSYSLGSFDYNIAWEGPLAGLLSLCKSNKHLSPDNTDYFRSINLTFLDTAGEEILDDDETPHNKFPEVDGYLKHLRELHNSVFRKVPVFVRPTLDNLLYTCKYLLFSDYHHNTGKRTYLILKNFLERVNSAGPLEGKVLGDRIQELAFILPGSMLINSVYLDNLDDLDGTSPVSKMFYAYEHFLHHIYTHFKGEGYSGKPELFLTLVNTDQIFSETYLDNTSMDRAGNVLASINLPNTVALAPERAYGFLIHEVSHFIIPDDNHGPRNSCFIKFYANYVTLQVHDYLKKNRKPLFNVEIFVEWFNEYLSLYPSAQGEELNDLTMTDLRDMLPKAMRDFAIEFNKSSASTRGRYLQYEISDELDKIVDTLKSKINRKLRTIVYEAILNVIHYKKHIKPLAKAFNDAFADILTLDMAFFKWDAFSDFYLGYFSDNKMDPYSDGWLAMRMAAVYIYHLCRSRGLNDPMAAETIAKSNLDALDRDEVNTSKDWFKFQRLILDKAYKNTAVLVPIVKYFLDNAKKREECLHKSGIPSNWEMQEKWESDEKLLYFVGHWMQGIYDINREGA